MTTPLTIKAAQVICRLEGHTNTTKHAITEIVRNMEGKAGSMAIDSLIERMLLLGFLSVGHAGLYVVHISPTKKIIVEVRPDLIVEDDPRGKYLGVLTRIENATERFGATVNITTEE